MTTTTQQDNQRPSSPDRLATLRGNCMGVAVLLIIQFGLGMGLNLYVTLPRHKAFFSTVFGSAVLAIHVLVALALLGAAIGAVVRAVRFRAAVVFASVGLAAVLAAFFAGAAFAGNQSNDASLSMALATAVALFSYVAAIFSIR
jgi:hypothetical protein